MCSHSHEHTHSHTHEHTHEHTHDHKHEHSHGEGNAAETAALMRYMVEHNRSHLGELEELAGSVSGEAHMKLHAAIDAFRAGNEQLASALRLFEED